MQIGVRRIRGPIRAEASAISGRVTMTNQLSTRFFASDKRREVVAPREASREASREAMIAVLRAGLVALLRPAP